MALLTSEFAMKDLGPLCYFFGIAVTKHIDGLFLSQSTYAGEIIARAGMASCKPSTTPVDTKQKLVCLHMLALKRILHYVQGTLHYGLHLYPFPIEKLISYTDADSGGCPDTRRSTSGYCVFLGDNLISWSSKRQPTLSRSSAKAEYRGVANVVSESCWFRNLLLELHFPLSQATLVYCDNVARGQARVLHVPSRHQIAVVFTKGLPRVLFDDFQISLNVREPPASTEGV
ncbi:uncharacterized mitochondrial protein AtMg00810-like [Medicago truncatula]|uniref:uncharacterized mitochondrial protein AtMg00810-like n=1 Tax=Medicago truncatula TaxID=3880 RepID=UPI000D2F1C16|nr:uncharacterized mitochondrial protein AtMg00810-like [Medicago truncatula]